MSIYRKNIRSSRQNGSNCLKVLWNYGPLIVWNVTFFGTSSLKYYIRKCKWYIWEKLTETIRTNSAVTNEIIFRYTITSDETAGGENIDVKCLKRHAFVALSQYKKLIVNCIENLFIPSNMTVRYWESTNCREYMSFSCLNCWKFALFGSECSRNG